MTAKAAQEPLEEDPRLVQARARLQAERARLLAVREAQTRRPPPGVRWNPSPTRGRRISLRRAASSPTRPMTSAPSTSKVSIRPSRPRSRLCPRTRPRRSSRSLQIWPSDRCSSLRRARGRRRALFITGNGDATAPRSGERRRSLTRCRISISVRGSALRCARPMPAVPRAPTLRRSGRSRRRHREPRGRPGKARWRPSRSGGCRIASKRLDAAGTRPYREGRPQRTRSASSSPARRLATAASASSSAASPSVWEW